MKWIGHCLKLGFEYNYSFVKIMTTKLWEQNGAKLTLILWFPSGFSPNILKWFKWLKYFIVKLII